MKRILTLIFMVLGAMFIVPSEAVMADDVGIEQGIVDLSSDVTAVTLDAFDHNPEVSLGPAPPDRIAVVDYDATLIEGAQLSLITSLDTLEEFRNRLAPSPRELAVNRGASVLLKCPTLGVKLA